jgi:hypothetical protein
MAVHMMMIIIITLPFFPRSFACLISVIKHILCSNWGPQATCLELEIRVFQPFGDTWSATV